MRLRLEGHFLEQKEQGTRAAIGTPALRSCSFLPRVGVAKKKPRKQEMPGGWRGSERKVGKWCDLRGASLVLVVSGNSEDIFVPVSDEMR